MYDLDRQPTFILLARLAAVHPERCTDSGWRAHPEQPPTQTIPRPTDRPRSELPPASALMAPVVIAGKPVQTVIAETARYHGFTPAQIRGTCQTRDLVLARWDAMHRLHRRGLSLAAIGRLVGRDHTTVLYGLRRYAGICAALSKSRRRTETQHEEARS